MGNVIEIRPLPLKKWHGKTGKEDFSRPLLIECYVDRIRGRYLTGLTAEDKERLEKATGYNLNDLFDPNTPHPFYGTQNGRVRLENKTNLFYMNNPLHEIKYKMLREHPLVANSMKEWEEGLFPGAKFVIYDDEQDLSEKVRKLDIKKSVFRNLDKADTQTKRQYYQILSNKSATEMSTELLETKLQEVIEQVGYERTLDLMNRDKEKNYIHSLIVEAVGKRVVNRKGDIYYYMDEPMGDLDDSIAFLQDMKNSMYKAAIIDKLNKKDKAGRK